MKYVALLSLIILGACTSFQAKPTISVHQIGKDTFTVRALSPDSTSAAKHDALLLANASCQKQARNVMVTNELSGIEDGTGKRYYDVTFYCLMPGDTDFQRVRPQTAPVQAQ